MLLLAGMIYSVGFLSRCGPAVAPETTRAIIQVESGGNPLAIGDNTLRKSFSPKTKREAINLATQLIDQSHSIDLGLMQVNSCHLGPMGITLEELFDDCQNVRIGTSILSGFYRRHRTGDPAYSLMLALSAYNTGQAWKGAGYVNKILVAAGVKYRVLFVPAEDYPGQPAPNAPVKKPRKKEARSRTSPFFFGNTTTALVPRRGFR